MKKKIQYTQIARFAVQIAFLILLPGLFSLTFGELRLIYNAIKTGSPSFLQLAPNLIEVFAIIPLTIILGRFFCGWFCAFGTFNDIMYFIGHKIFKINFKINEQLDEVLKYVKYIVLILNIVFIWVVGSTLFNTASPWDAFAPLTSITQLGGVPQAISQYLLGFILLILIGIGSLFIERFFCRYLCPLGALFALLSKIRIFNIAKPTDKCGKCRICTNNCAMGIPLYKSDKVTSGECINCLKCTEVCPRRNIHGAILDEEINPVLASAITIAAFTGIYAGGNALAGNSLSSVVSNNSSISSSLTTAKAKGNYKDGTYTGEGTGYAPGLKVSVTIKNGNISSIEILACNDTPRFSQTPLSQIPQEIITAQSTNVDTVSGATRTSNGIIEAVNNALAQASSDTTATTNSDTTANTNANTDSTSETSSNSSTTNSGTTDESSNASNNQAASTSQSSQPSSAASQVATTSSTYKDGTYTGEGTGYRPGLQVSVTVKNGKISAVEVLSNNETPRFSQMPIQQIPQEIIAAQSTKVDTVSGATRTSNGIIEAVNNALSQALNS